MLTGNDTSPSHLTSQNVSFVLEQKEVGTRPLLVLLDMARTTTQRAGGIHTALPPGGGKPVCHFFPLGISFIVAMMMFLMVFHVGELRFLPGPRTPQLQGVVIVFQFVPLRPQQLSNTLYEVH